MQTAPSACDRPDEEWCIAPRNSGGSPQDDIRARVKVL